MFAVRENYLLKVAARGEIGERICFQGATARNRALVAAFEQELGKPIAVSRYCHLTGAYGAALTLAEEMDPGIESSFRGLGIAERTIPIRIETCGYCLNHCRIRIAEVAGEEVAYGFLCGRDYQTKRYIPRLPKRLDLPGRRKSHFFGKTVENPATLGIPAMLHLYDDLPFWMDFLKRLGIDFTTSLNKGKSTHHGERIAGAEFCAPISHFHDHIVSVAKRSHWILCPVYIEDRNSVSGHNKNSSLRKYCYYTQFAPSLGFQTLERENFDPGRFIRPIIDPRRGEKIIIKSIYESFKPLLGKLMSLNEMEFHYRESTKKVQSLRSSWASRFSPPSFQGTEPEIVLLGRPYAVFDDSLNKRIPELIADQGLIAWYQDMLPVQPQDREDDLLSKIHWHYAAEVLSAAYYCAKTPGLYPILMTCFKCNPDSFVIEHVKHIMDSVDKPYLVLQLDEHESSVGYQTRIEAATRAFRNHYQKDRESSATNECLQNLSWITPTSGTQLENKKLVKEGVLLFPNFDATTARFLVANLQRSGFDARLLEENQSKIHKSIRHNSGQCLPLNIIAQETVDYIHKYSIEPSDATVWMYKSTCACSIGVFPYFLKNLISRIDKNLTDVEVYRGDIIFMDISIATAIRAYCAFLLGGVLRSLGCKIRPYERFAGTTDRTIEIASDILESAFKGKRSLRKSARLALGLFDEIEIVPGNRPKVAVFGDLYSRDNEVFNQNLIRSIEIAGGEAITTPFSHYLKIISSALFLRLAKERQLKQLVIYKTMLSIVEIIEWSLSRHFSAKIGKYHRSPIKRVESYLERFYVNLYNEGESYDNILKIFEILRHHPDVSLFVQASPELCCPSLVTEAMKSEIEAVTGVPIVSINYDGTAAQHNEIVFPYVRAAASRFQ